MVALGFNTAVSATGSYIEELQAHYNAIGIEMEQYIELWGRDPSRDPKVFVSRGDRLIAYVGEYDQMLTVLLLDTYLRTSVVRSRNIAVNESIKEYFAAAELYASRKQVREAKEVYRKIIRIYTGTAYQGYRDRAKMELDALNEARR